MSVIHTWACFLLWVGLAAQEKTPDVSVKCIISEACVLPCSFPPGGDEMVEWFKRDTLVYKFERNGSDGSKERSDQNQLSVSTLHISTGNASLILKRSGFKDRGAYRCHVQTSGGQHDAKVILKVEAPIRGLFLELSRLSGYEELKCSVRDVYPAPRVTWDTEPPTYEALRPVTRMHADRTGLFTVDSRLKRLKGNPALNYICKVSAPYGGPMWTASLKVREIRGAKGKDLTLPCSAPSYMDNAALHWTFSSGEETSTILSYDSRSKHISSPPPWDSYVELDAYKVTFGEGSLRLMDPKPLEHSGSYTCEFSLQHSKHTEHNDVTIGDPSEPKTHTSKESSYWWVLGVVAALLVLAVAAMWAFFKFRGKRTKSRNNNPDEETELNRVKDAAAAQ